MRIFQSWINLIQFINEFHPSEIIHPCGWIEITLNFKLQVISLKFQAQVLGSCTHHLQVSSIGYLGRINKTFIKMR